MLQLFKYHHEICCNFLNIITNKLRLKIVNPTMFLHPIRIQKLTCASKRISANVAVDFKFHISSFFCNLVYEAMKWIYPPSHWLIFSQCKCWVTISNNFFASFPFRCARKALGNSSFDVKIMPIRMLRKNAFINSNKKRARIWNLKSTATFAKNREAIFNQVHSPWRRHAMRKKRKSCFFLTAESHNSLKNLPNINRKNSASYFSPLWLDLRWVLGDIMHASIVFQLQRYPKIFNPVFLQLLLFLSFI